MKKKLEPLSSGPRLAQVLFSVAATTNPRVAAAGTAPSPGTTLPPAVPPRPEGSEEAPPPLAGMRPAETPAGEPDWSAATGPPLGKMLAETRGADPRLGSDTEETDPRGGMELDEIEESPPRPNMVPVGSAVAKAAGGGKVPRGGETGEVVVQVKQEEEGEER